ncbi:MAG: hypothetical protein COX43_02555 [Parcubacteria group bacterium CG23_combo_of_CG06-09_8_20_14_all_35_9]|nr:MAG: hypothetical protein COX43_02555 [Parcubacteria group bacterium CG23_combo_of_CG06-09_8_20_14_all_35_9]
MTEGREQRPLPEKEQQEQEFEIWMKKAEKILESIINKGNELLQNEKFKKEEEKKGVIVKIDGRPYKLETVWPSEYNKPEIREIQLRGEWEESDEEKKVKMIEIITVAKGNPFAKNILECPKYVVLGDEKKEGENPERIMQSVVQRKFGGGARIENPKVGIARLEEIEEQLKTQ